MISPVRNRKNVKIKPNNKFSIICTKIRGIYNFHLNKYENTKRLEKAFKCLN